MLQLVDPGAATAIRVTPHNLPVGTLPSRVISDGTIDIDVRRMVFPSLVYQITLIPASGIAQVGSKSEHRYRCFSCDVLWTVPLKPRPCWYCGETRLLPEARPGEVYAPV